MCARIDFAPMLARELQRPLGRAEIEDLILTGLNEGQQPTPPDDDAIGLWCAGYLKAARMDDVWSDDERGFVFLFPHAMLSGEVDLVGEEDSHGNMIEDPAPQLRRCRERLDATVPAANAHWTAWRRKNIAKWHPGRRRSGARIHARAGAG